MIVTCICITADRPAFTAEAISHFHAQTYPAESRRLLVFDTSAAVPSQLLTRVTEESINAGLAGESGPSLWASLDVGASAPGRAHAQHHYQPRLPGDTIGALRNRAIALALTLWPDTSLLAHMDSDDYYGPERLTAQIDQLIASGKSVAGFSTAKFTDGVTWWKYKGTPTYALGASLLYKAEYWRSNQFPALQVGEDNIWTRNAWNSGQLHRAEGCGDLLASYTDRDLLVVRCHAGNTDRKIPRNDWQVLPG